MKREGFNVCRQKDIRNSELRLLQSSCGAADEQSLTLTVGQVEIATAKAR